MKHRNLLGLFRSSHVFRRRYSEGVAQACNFIKKRPQHQCFPVKFEEFLGTLRKTVSVCLISKYFSKEQLRICTRRDIDRVQISIFLSITILFDADISFIKYKLKNVPLTFQLTFLSNFWLRALKILFLTLGKLGRYDVAQKSFSVERKFRLV